MYAFILMVLILLIYPVLSGILVYIVGNIDLSLLKWPQLWSYVTFVIFLLIFYKDLRLKSSFKIPTWKDLVLALLIVFALHISMIFIHNIDMENATVYGWNRNPYQIIFFVLLTPIFEEMGFRILIINKFKHRLNFWIIAIIISIYFALIHFGSFYAHVSLFIFSLVLVRLYYILKNGTLLILIHVLYNGIIAIENTLWKDFFNANSALLQSPTYYIIAGVSMTMLSFLFFKTGWHRVKGFLN